MEKRGIFGIFLVLAILVFAGFSLAENETEEEEENVGDLDFDEGQGYDWLIEQLELSNWGNDVETISWAVLALYSSNYEEYQVGVDRLLDLRAPVGNNWGTVFDTSMAVLALDTVGEDVEDAVEWLMDQQQPNLAGGQWLIQFNPDDDDTQATCAIGYEGTETQFTMEGYNLTADCPLVDGSWVDFVTCIKQYDEADIYEPMSVDCTSSRVSTSLLFYSGGAFYIIDEDDADDELEIKNGCFYGPAGGCDCYYSQFGSWALEEAGDGSYSVPYLRATCNDDIQDNAFLYMLTGGNSYKDWLQTEGQSGDGSFGPGNIELTALSVIALRTGGSGSVMDAVNWLEFVQDGFTGSWNQDERLTGMVLYALNIGGGNYIPTYDDYCSVDDGDECETSNDCNGTLVCSNLCSCVEESDSCISDDDCQVGETCNFYTGQCELQQTPTGCSNNLDCARGYYCDTSTGQCVAEEGFDDDDDDYVPPTQEDSSWVTWLVAILVVVLALALGWFVYNKFIKGKSKKGGEGGPAFVPRRPATPGYPGTRNNVPARAPVRRTGRGEAKLEKDLDKALKKAKELVGK